MKYLLIIALLTVVVVVTANRPERAKRPPTGRPLSQHVVDLSRNKGPTSHDAHGKIHVAHGGHKPVRHDQIPKKQLTIYHQHEIPKSSVIPNFAVHHGCSYSVSGQWDTSLTTPIVFEVCPTGSGMSAEELIDVFDTAAAIIHEAVPKLKRQLVFNHLPHGAEFESTLHQPVNITRVPDGINHIGFAPRSIIYEGQNIISEVYVLKDKDTRNHIECDIVLSSDSNVGWSHFKKHQTGNPNHWHHDHYGGFDAVSSALWALGHALGLGGTDAHTHTMHAGSARGTFHKRSLECGDINGLKAIYGR